MFTIDFALSMNVVTAVVLAAGRGTRMGTQRPKVLHTLRGRTLVEHVVAAAEDAGADAVIVVTGHGGAEVRGYLDALFPGKAALKFVEQPEQRGTGHAVLCALPEVPAEGVVLVLSGDVPLLTSRTLGRLLAAHARASSGLALCAFEPGDAHGYGRIVRDGAGRVIAVVEQRDTSAAQRAISECNAGTYAIEGAWLHDALPRLGTDNAQAEIYLTDLVASASGRGEVGVVKIDPWEAAGVNTPAQLAALEHHLASG